jgi:hypothetical protein
VVKAMVPNLRKYIAGVPPRQSVWQSSGNAKKTCEFGWLLGSSKWVLFFVLFFFFCLFLFSLIKIFLFSKKAESDRSVMGKNFVLEIVSLSDGPVVMSFGSLQELERWAMIVKDAASFTSTDSAFPGIRVIQVMEQPDDESWRVLVGPGDGWRVERSSTPLDVTFGDKSGGEQSE